MRASLGANWREEPGGGEGAICGAAVAGEGGAVEGRRRWKRGRRRRKLEAQWRWHGRRWASRAVDCLGRSTAQEGGW
eukprot:6510701-Prymnesium_polylepis.1